MSSASCKPGVGARGAPAGARGERDCYRCRIVKQSAGDEHIEARVAFKLGTADMRKSGCDRSTKGGVADPIDGEEASLSNPRRFPRKHVSKGGCDAYGGTLTLARQCSQARAPVFGRPGGIFCSQSRRYLFPSVHALT